MSAADSFSPKSPRVNLNIIWHLHQPDYRDPTGAGDMLLPWVRMHACRSYTDIAWLLEKYPLVRITLNLSPVLVDQIDDLAHGRCGDRYLDLSRRSTGDLSKMDKIEILKGFFSVDWETGIRPIARYWQLLHKRGRDIKLIDFERIVNNFCDSDFLDLQVLFNLTWMGAKARATEPLVQNLLKKEKNFSEIEKNLLLDLQEKYIRKVLPRWRSLAARGQIELSASPYYHPILPLLNDTDTARESMPESPLPPRCRRPKDVALQIDRAIEAHQRHFGSPPSGLWPPEGSVSHETASMLPERNISWIATDEIILRKSTPLILKKPGMTDHFQPWNISFEKGDLSVFFRDRTLSELVDFSYSTNPPLEAALDLMQRLGRTVRNNKDSNQADFNDNTCVTLVLDGEDSWGRYPDYGREFLEALFQHLSSQRKFDGVTIRTSTPSRWLSENRPPRSLSNLHAGSWLDDCFRFWIGGTETNRAWSLISAAGHILDNTKYLAPENREEALNHLLVAESSDWTFSYGASINENPEIFDALFRARLLKIYELTGEATPAELRCSLSRSPDLQESIVPLREPWSLIAPLINGMCTPVMDWQGAGVYRPGYSMTRSYRVSSRIDVLRYGCDPTELYIRLDLTEDASKSVNLGELIVQILTCDRVIDVSFPLRKGKGKGRIEGFDNCKKSDTETGRVCFNETIEIALPFSDLSLQNDENLSLIIRLVSEGVEIERLPRYGHLNIRIPSGNIPISGFLA